MNPRVDIQPRPPHPLVEAPPQPLEQAPARAPELAAAMPEPAWWREPSRAQWIGFAAAWMGWVLDAFDFTVFLMVMPAIAKDFHVSQTATSVSITLTLLVRLVGGLVAGAAADRWGRRLPLMISIVWFAACDGGVALAPSFGWVLVLRTIFGFGMGAEWTSGAALAMESWPQRSRGLASGVLQGSWALGYILAAVVYQHVLPVWGWRGVFVAAALPALLVLPIRIWVKESPDFERARAEQKRVGLLAELRSTGAGANLAWASGVMALGFAAYYGLTSQYPSLLQTQLHLDIPRVSGLVTRFNLGMMIGAIGCGALAARRGPRLAIILPAVSTLVVLAAYVGWVPGLLSTGAVVCGAVGAGYAGVTPLLLTRLFPARIRARSIGLVYHTGAVLAAPVPTVIAALGGVVPGGLATAIVAIVSGANLLIVVALLAYPKKLWSHAES
jgi:SHS family lactate transporter-like MFS transporter